ncbi:MAG: capsule assembly Wzi family protein [Bacteroidales bacterium]|nr:capsule assembly Wzi family protein [Bacteroidales bacterium]
MNYLGSVSHFRYIYLIILFVVTIFSDASAQIDYKIESIGRVGNGTNSPFWFNNNQQGLATNELSSGYLRASLSKEFSDSTRKWEYRFGVDVMKSTGYQTNPLFQQLYFDIRYKKAILSVGSKESFGILKNQELSSGGFSWSGNARPIPQFKIETDGYLSSSKIFHRRLKLKMEMSYGWFTDEAYIKQVMGKSTDNVLYHAKKGILKYDFKNEKWSAYGGFETYAQFGGDRKDLKQYFMVLFPTQGDSKSGIIDQVYVFGSSRGSWHIMGSYHPKAFELNAYIENFFDDFSGLIKQNRLDGLWGLEYKNKELKNSGVRAAVLEYFQSTDQSGPIHWAIHDTPNTKLTEYSATGSDGYFNSVYNEAWSHWGMMAGNPLISSPIYGKNGIVGIFNNRVKAIHAGITYKFSNSLDLKALATYSLGWGTFEIPFRRISTDNMSMFELKYSPQNFKGWHFFLSTGIDRGDLYGNNNGFSFKISKEGVLLSR